MIVTRSNFRAVVDEIIETPGDKAFDTETTGAREEDRLFLFTISTEKDDYLFNFQEYPNDNLDEMYVLPKVWIPELNPATNADWVTWFMHEAKFDLRMALNEGLTFKDVYCTKAMGRVLQNNYMGDSPYSLESSAARIGFEKLSTVWEYIMKHKLYTKVSIPGKKKLELIPHFDRVPWAVITEYALRDSNITLKLGKHIKEAIQQKELDLVEKNERRLTKVCFKAERAGIKLDTSYVLKASDFEAGIMKAKAEEFTRLTGRPYSDQKSILIPIFREAGEAIPQTAKGNDSLNDDALSKMKSPAAKLVQEIRHYEKRIGTYYSSFLFLKDNRDYIHADMQQGGTETGRFSYRSPNLQNLPKEDEPEDLKKDYLVRGCFVPDSDDFVFVAIDYSQQEYRMMIDYAGEKRLIDAVMGGADVHQATADLVGISRKNAKNLNFAILYGAGADKIASMIGCSVSDAKALKNTYYSKLPKVELFIHKVITVGKQRGYIRNWMNRRCHISSPEFAYILPNHLIQGGCADVVKIAMNRTDAILEGKKSHLKLQVHDELLFSVHKSELDLVPVLHKAMEDVYIPRNGMRLTASAEHSWKSYSAKDKQKGFPR